MPDLVIYCIYSCADASASQIHFNFKLLYFLKKGAKLNKTKKKKGDLQLEGYRVNIFTLISRKKEWYL